MGKENTGKKCIAIHLPIDLWETIDEFKSKTGKSQSGLIIDLLRKGLGISEHEKLGEKVLFFVKVRIDLTKMAEFGLKLQNGEIDTSQIILTYCDKSDPSVGMSFWQAETKEIFDLVFAQHRVYYKELIELVQVISPMDSMKLLMETMKAH